MHRPIGGHRELLLIQRARGRVGWFTGGSCVKRWLYLLLCLLALASCLAGCSARSADAQARAALREANARLRAHDLAAARDAFEIRVGGAAVLGEI